MATISLIWGILSVIGLIIAFFPCLGSLNWLNIPFSLIGLIISLVASNSSSQSARGRANTGAILCAIAVVIGFLRLVASGGVV